MLQEGARSVKAVVFVATGEVWATGRQIVLRADGLGSCVALVAYDAQCRIGALAHIMLPGRSSVLGNMCNTKYAGDAVQNLLFKMTRLGAEKHRLEACLIGGANVLLDENDTLCPAIVHSVSTILAQERIEIVARATGGTVRRWATLDVPGGMLCCCEGDGAVRALYRWGGCYCGQANCPGHTV